MPIRFTHTRLLVSKFEACFLFYRDVLGLVPAFGDEKGPYADFEGTPGRLALFSRQMMAEVVGRAAEPAAVEAQDRVALIFAVDDVDAEYERLKALGVTFAALPANRPDWGLRSANFRDPDGNLIEINRDLSPSELARL